MDTKSIMDAVPERLMEWKKDGEAGLALILVPRFRRRPLSKWLQPRLKRPHMRIKLDEIGSAVWENCDGKKTVREIAAILEGQFGDKVKPVEERLRLFFNSLYKQGFVRYWMVH